MKKQILKTMLFTLVAAALVTVPAISRADDSTNAPAVKTSKKSMLHGKADAVDTAAMTLTVGTQVVNVTSATKITKDNKPATLEEVMVGDAVSVSYKKGDDGKLNATSIHDGLMSSKKKKKAASDSSSTNAPAAGN
jgi:hypothetical protein